MLHVPSGNARKGFLLALLTAGMWGGLPVALKLLLRDIDAYTLTFVRFAVAAGILMIILGSRGVLRRHRGHRPIRLLLLAAFGLGGNYITYIASLQYISPGTAQVVIQLAPVMFIIGSVFFFKEKFAAAQWVALFALVVGLLLFFNNRLSELASKEGQLLIGLGLIFLSSLTWALYAMAQKQVLTSMGSMDIMLWIYTACALAFLPTISFGWIESMTLLGALLLIFVSANTVIAYGAFSESLNHWEASKVSAVLAITPLLTIGSSHVIALLAPAVAPKESLNAWSYIGAGIVVVSSAAIALKKPKALPTPR